MGVGEERGEEEGKRGRGREGKRKRGRGRGRGDEGVHSSGVFMCMALCFVIPFNLQNFLHLSTLFLFDFTFFFYLFFFFFFFFRPREKERKEEGDKTRQDKTRHVRLHKGY